MSQENVDVVLAQFVATNEPDFERAMSYYADDVELDTRGAAGPAASRSTGKTATSTRFATTRSLASSCTPIPPKRW
jgi:hypothetical protein